MLGGASRARVTPIRLVHPPDFSVLQLGTFKEEVSKQGVTTFAWRPGSEYDVAAMRGADSVLASDCRAQFGRPSTRRGCRICVTVRLPVRPRGETMYWQANANTPLSITPLLNVPDSDSGREKGVITEGVISLRGSLEPLENDGFLLFSVAPHSGD